MKIQLIQITFIVITFLPLLYSNAQDLSNATEMKDEGGTLSTPTKDLAGGDTNQKMPPVNLEPNAEDTLAETLKNYEPRLRDLQTRLNELEDRRSKDVSTGIYNTSEDGRLDFEDQHKKMIAGLTQATDLSRKYRFLHNELLQLGREIRAAGANVTVDMKGVGAQKYRYLDQQITDATTLCQRSSDEVTEYRNAINDTLIETVHRYHVRNDFRFYMGAGWFVCFLVLAAVCFNLFKRKILVPQDSSSLQLVAMVMIIFVVMLFGITDVIGENGVTGILAAIAGYILGKSSLNDSVPRKVEVNDQVKESAS